MHARVYWNLHRNLWSVQVKVGKSWKVVEHASTVALGGVSFTVSEAGRQRVLRTKRKNVHSYATGYLIGTESDALSFSDSWQGLPEVTYNPYKFSTFVRTSDRTPIASASRAYLLSDRRVLAVAD